MAKLDFLDGLMPESIDAEQWKQESKTRQAESQNQKKRGIRDFWMRDGDMPKLVTFLNEGLQVQLHTHWDQGPPQFFLCKPAGHKCEFCDSGKKANRHVVYAVIDWFYHDKNKQQVDRPEVKLLIRGRDDYKLFESRRKNRRQGDGTLLGRKWEVIRTGNKYDITADAEIDIPWDKTVLYKRKSDGVDIDIPFIKSYDWPEYPQGEETIWTIANTRDSLPPMDWSKPEFVDRWILAHLANRPFSEYQKYAGVAAKRNTSQPAPSGPPKSIPSVKAGDEIQF